MELTHSAAEFRLATLKRVGIVVSMSNTTGAFCRLTMRVAELTDEAKRRVEEALAGTHWSYRVIEAGKPGAAKLTSTKQRRCFEELSRELGTDNGETLDAVFGKIVPPKVPVAKGQS